MMRLTEPHGQPLSSACLEDEWTDVRVAERERERAEEKIKRERERAFVVCK